MNSGRTIRPTAVIAGSDCRFFPLYCPLNVLHALLCFLGFYFAHLLQLLYHKRRVLHVHGETYGGMNLMPFVLMLCCVTWPRGPILLLCSTHMEALMCFNRISTLGSRTQKCFFVIYSSGKNARTRAQTHTYTPREVATSVFQRLLLTGHFIRDTIPVQGTQ